MQGDAAVLWVPNEHHMLGQVQKVLRERAVKNRSLKKKAPDEKTTRANNLFEKGTNLRVETTAGSFDRNE